MRSIACKIAVHYRSLASVLSKRPSLHNHYNNKLIQLKNRKYRYQRTFINSGYYYMSKMLLNLHA